MGFKETIAKCRNNKKCRMIIMGILFLILVILFFTWGKAKAMLIVGMVLLAIAMGLDGFDYDADIQKLWETKSYSESRVETIKDSDGNSVRVITGAKCNSKEFDLNCDNFSTQPEAQAKYQECADAIASDNPGVDVKKLDVYGLDGNNNGVVCEILPG